MDNYLGEVHDFCHKHSIPLVIAGDIFDKANSRAELVNFAMRRFPKTTFTVPGNHDLPNHNYEDRHKSSYWTLVEAGVIEDLPPQTTIAIGPKFTVQGFPWGCDLQSTEPSSGEAVQLAVVHKYVWTDTYSGYDGADYKDRVVNVVARNKSLEGFDAVVFGDNHKSFSGRFGDLSFLNPGSFLRRRSDEVDHKPRIGLLWSDGSITEQFLDTKDDEWDEAFLKNKLAKKLIEDLGSEDAEELVDLLSALKESGLDFYLACKHFLSKKKVGDAVGKWVLEFAREVQDG